LRVLSVLEKKATTGKRLRITAPGTSARACIRSDEDLKKRLGSGRRAKNPGAKETPRAVNKGS
jgi:hypothetical protein